MLKVSTSSRDSTLGLLCTPLRRRIWSKCPHRSRPILTFQVHLAWTTMRTWKLPTRWLWITSSGYLAFLSLVQLLILKFNLSKSLAGPIIPWQLQTTEKSMAAVFQPREDSVYLPIRLNLSIQMSSLMSPIFTSLFLSQLSLMVRDRVYKSLKHTAAMISLFCWRSREHCFLLEVDKMESTVINESIMVPTRIFPTLERLLFLQLQ